MVYGGVALPAWGDVITTQDLDLLVQVDEAEAARLIAAYRDAGFRVPDDAEAHFPIATWTRASLGGRDVDIAWGATEFDDSALSRAVISDPIYNLTFQFVGGIAPPPAPGPWNCGPDPTDDVLTCVNFAKCQLTEQP